MSAPTTNSKRCRSSVSLPRPARAPALGVFDATVDPCSRSSVIGKPGRDRPGVRDVLLVDLAARGEDHVLRTGGHGNALDGQCAGDFAFLDDLRALGMTIDQSGGLQGREVDGIAFDA